MIEPSSDPTTRAGKPARRRSPWLWVGLWLASILVVMALYDRQSDALRSELAGLRFLVASAKNLSLDYTIYRASHGSWPPTAEVRKELMLASSAYDARLKARVDVYRHGSDLVFILGDDGGLMYAIEESPKAATH